MKLTRYTSFFHDGSILSINHAGNKMVFSIESAEMDEEDMQDDIALGNDDRIRGKLHLEEIISIKKDGSPYLDVLRMWYEDAEIFHFKLGQSKVEFQIKWNTYPPKPGIEDFSTIEIEAKKIWWENIPDLEVS